MKYAIIYHWNVLEEIEDGNRVYALDRDNNNVYDVNELKVKDAIELIKIDEENDTRIEFWKEVKEENENG